MLTSLLLYVGHFFKILLKFCYFFLFFNIKNPSFPSTLSTFLTFSYFQLVIFLNILFLSIFGHFGTSGDIKMRCTGPVFLPFGRSLGGFGGVLVNPWGLLGRQGDQDAPKSSKDASRRPPRHPQRPPRGTPETSKRPKNCSKIDFFVVFWLSVSSRCHLAMLQHRPGGMRDAIK